MDERQDNLTPLEWLMPRTYITQILFFPSTHPEVPGVLQLGLSGLLTDIPYLASGIVRRTNPTGAVKMSEPYQSAAQLLSFEDLTSLIDYNVLKAQNFAPSAVEAVSLPTGLGECNDEPFPVFRAVVCKVRHGFVLSMSLHHSTTDITGFGVLMRLWAEHCKAGSKESDVACGAMLNRGSLTASVAPLAPLANAQTRLPKLLRIVDGTPNVQPYLEEGVQLVTEILRLEKKTLQSLKDRVTDHLHLNGLPWISTGDIVTALLWAAIDFSDMALRNLPDVALHKGMPARSVGFPVNFRNRCRPALPDDYLGSAFLMTSAVAQEIDLVNIATTDDGPAFIASLARVAAAVRRGINLVNPENITSILSYLGSQQDITKVKLGMQSSQFSLVSWADEGVYDLDWGTTIGFCESLRLPTSKAKRHPIVLPRLHNGDLEVYMCLETSTLERLKNLWFLNQKRQER